MLNVDAYHAIFALHDNSLFPGIAWSRMDISRKSAVCVKRRDLFQMEMAMEKTVFAAAGLFRRFLFDMVLGCTMVFHFLCILVVGYGVM